MNKKQVWSARLPQWRENAVGRLRAGEVYLVAQLSQDASRLITVEIPTEHARALAADLLYAAKRAETGPDSPVPAVTRIQQQLELDLQGFAR